MLTEVQKYEMFKEHFEYCKDTGVFTRKKDGSKVLTNSNGYVRLNKSFKGKKYYIIGQNMAWYMVYGKIPSKIIDHIDRVRDNNRVNNLREACSQQNARNTSKHTTGDKGRSFTSQYKGVRFLNKFYPKSGNPVKKPFQARIRLKVGGLDHSLGCYATEEEAARAYDDAAKKHFGEFAVCNFED